MMIFSHISLLQLKEGDSLFLPRLDEGSTVMVCLSSRCPLPIMLLLFPLRRRCSDRDCRDLELTERQHILVWSIFLSLKEQVTCLLARYLMELAHLITFPCQKKLDFVDTAVCMRRFGMNQHVLSRNLIFPNWRFMMVIKVVNKREK